jgi:hypothetical protein
MIRRRAFGVTATAFACSVLAFGYPPAEDIVTFSYVEVTEGSNNPTKITFPQASPYVAQVNNKYVDNDMKIFGTYAPTGEGNNWIIKVSFGVGSTAETFDANLNNGEWYILVPKQRLSKNTEYDVNIDVAKNNSKNASKPDKHGVAFGAQE